MLDTRDRSGSGRWPRGMRWAIVTCMSYLDVNPIRAGLAQTPDESAFTLIPSARKPDGRAGPGPDDRLDYGRPPMPPAAAGPPPHAAPTCSHSA